VGQAWRLFLVAVVATLLIAVGVGVGVSRLDATAPPAPRLHTVPADTLSRAGIVLGGASQPPYCGVEDRAVERGWLAARSAECAVGRDRAAAAALPGGRGAVLEAVLARVSGDGVVGHGRLAWVMVVRSDLLLVPANACAPPSATGPACAVARLGPVSNQAVVIVDGATGQVLRWVPVPGQSAPDATGSGAAQAR